MPQDDAGLNERLHESVYSFALRSLLLQLIMVLLFMIAALLLFFFLAAMGSTASLGTYLIVIGICLSVVDVTLLIYLLLQWQATSYSITDQAISVTKGVLNRHTEIYKTDGIEAVEVEQSPLGKQLGYGTVSFFYPSLGKRIELFNISNPERYADIIRRASGGS
jgi:membrane protein YdbS with pleckstrin-like domain